MTVPISVHHRGLPLSPSSAYVLSKSLFSLTSFFYWLLVCLGHVCSVQGYWEGYKLFCYAYYSHSMQHEYEFQQSKLGSLLAYTILSVFNRLVVCFLLLARMLRSCWHFTISPPVLVLHRATGLEAPCPPSSSIPPYAPNNMHADPSSCRDVL
jgi:hypothetical protein